MAEKGSRYAPEVFLTKDLAAAKAIILTPEQGLSPEQRWEQETAWMTQHIRFDTAGLIVDYGCGAGRLSQRIPQPVLGVDISPTMRAQAEQYCRRGDFGTCSPPMLDVLVRNGLKVHGALAVWVFQHVLNPNWDVRVLANAMVPGSVLWLVNRNNRAVPVVTESGQHAWASDGIDVEAIVCEFFEQSSREPMPTELCAPGSFISKWVRLGNAATVDAAARPV